MIDLFSEETFDLFINTIVLTIVFLFGTAYGKHERSD